MALIKFPQDNPVYALATGRIYSLKSKTASNGKTVSTFSIVYNYEKEFDTAKNLYVSCVAWSTLGEFVAELLERPEKPNLLVTGKIKKSEYNGTEREQIECDYIAIQQYTLSQIEKPKRQKSDDDFNDLPI